VRNTEVSARVSKQNVELHRRAYEAFNADDMDEFVAYCDPSIEFHSVFAALGGAVYRGHDGVRKWRSDLEDVWGKEIRVEPQAYFDLGEHTLALYVVRARGLQSGADVAMPNAQVAKWRDALCIYLKTFATQAEALSDLGISEDVLEAIEP
jgi:ketosteroid isomerase-like protein